MTNADKFKSLFGLYATELWSMPEKDFLEWLNSEVSNPSESPNGWIPTSKERPPQNQEIWITNDLGDVELVYGKDGKWVLYESYYTEPEIIAWMPANVPSHYQPKEDES